MASSLARDPFARGHRESRRADHHGARSLAGLIEGEIIPRLMIAHPAEAVRPSTGAPAITPADIAAFLPLTVEGEAADLVQFADGLLARGVTVDALLVDLLAPVARALGVEWEKDRVDFVAVTMALWRLQEVVHELAARAPGVHPAAHSRRRALFAPAPGDQHGFGALVIEEVFAREGWSTERLAAPRTLDLVERVAGDWFDIVGLTTSCDALTASLPSMIAAMRSVSRNPQLRVLVGGRVFIEDPSLAARVGADATARDARLAVRVAAEMVDALVDGVSLTA
jgi:methanogenic corrinoid protein MtbC1